MTKQEMLQLKMTATRVRMGIIEATHGGKSGHPGGSLSAADVLTYLYFKEMQIDPQNPQDPDRDRFVLSKGHAAPGLYSVLAERGFFPVADLPTLRRSGSYLQGHPNMNTVPGVDMSTGSLGQGVSAAAGMALAAKMKNPDVNVYTLLGDGEIEEGECWEAFMFANHYKLDNLCIMIDVNGLQSVDYSKFKHYNMCAMEYVYFARPDSDIEGTNVHAFRKETGRMLYEEAPVDADIVVGVPDSSLSAAIGYSEASGIPYEMGLIKNKYVGRTFIQPSQELREKGVRMKLSPVRSIVEGKRLVIVDDSIVRGTTSRRIVKMLRQSGAKEIHMRIASPAITHPCFYGVDMSTYDELICAREKDLEAVRRLIGADSLVWLSPEALYKAAGGRKELCIACFNGRYPTALYQSIHDVNKDKKC